MNIEKARKIIARHYGLNVRDIHDAEITAEVARLERRLNSDSMDDIDARLWASLAPILD
jgi:hypothetical protein